MFDFTDRVVIVTGAAGNLGQAVAAAFRAAGARLVLVDRDPDRLLRLFADLAGSAEALLAGGVDLTDEGAVNQMVAGARPVRPRGCAGQCRRRLPRRRART